jgi:hypothetical protein
MRAAADVERDQPQQAAMAERQQLRLVAAQRGFLPPGSG